MITTALANSHTFTGCQALTTTANSCQMEVQDVNVCDTHTDEMLRVNTQIQRLSYPPEVLPVSIFQQCFVGVAFPHQRAKTCSFGNQLIAGHPKYLFNKKDMKSSNNRVAHKLEA